MEGIAEYLLKEARKGGGKGKKRGGRGAAAPAVPSTEPAASSAATPAPATAAPAPDAASAPAPAPQKQGFIARLANWGLKTPASPGGTTPSKPPAKGPGRIAALGQKVKALFKRTKGASAGSPPPPSPAPTLKERFTKAREEEKEWGKEYLAEGGKGLTNIVRKVVGPAAEAAGAVTGFGGAVKESKPVQAAGKLLWRAGGGIKKAIKAVGSLTEPPKIQMPDEETRKILEAFGHKVSPRLAPPPQRRALPGPSSSSGVMGVPEEML